MSLPFELSKKHKSNTKYTWKSYGIIFADDYHFEYVYDMYIHETNCDLCNKLFLKSYDRQLEHDHETGEIRNIVCCKCNNHKKDYKMRQSNTGYEYISKCNDDTMKLGYKFQVKITRDGKRIFITNKNTLEKAIICRDEFLKNHPEIYT